VSHSVAPHGTIVIAEWLVNKTRTAPPHSLMFAVNMLVHSRRGRHVLVRGNQQLTLRSWIPGRPVIRRSRGLSVDPCDQDRLNAFPLSEGAIAQPSVGGAVSISLDRSTDATGCENVLACVSAFSVAQVLETIRPMRRRLGVSAKDWPRKIAAFQSYRAPSSRWFRPQVIGKPEGAR
jgi:hypothetical protein